MCKLYYFSKTVPFINNEDNGSYCISLHGYKGIEAETDPQTMDRWSLHAVGWNWEHPHAGTAVYLYLREMDWDSDPFPCLMTPGSHNQGQTVKAGEQGTL